MGKIWKWSLFLVAVSGSGCHSSVPIDDARVLSESGETASARASSDSQFVLQLDAQVLNAKLVPFIGHDNALAMNIPYAPILNLRQQLEKNLSKKLDFLRSWNSGGEAHITIITPPEYQNVLSKKLKMEEIDKIAKNAKIQDFKIEISGLGSGQSLISGKAEETYFLLVSSPELLELRKSILSAFVAKGGDPKLWDFKAFYPHITIGYTKRDLHIQDGVIKDVEHSLDRRFKLSMGTSNGGEG